MKEGSKMINEIFPIPKFTIGQEVKIRENYTHRIIDEKYIIAEIKLSCLSVITELKGKKEPFTYSMVKKEFIGLACAFTGFKMDIKESFIVAV